MKNRYIILAALSALLYLPTLFGGFMWDDEDIITGDYVVHSAANAGRVFSPGYWKRDFPGAESRYRPLRSLLIMAEWKAWGARPQGYHAARILLNAAAVCLAFWLALLVLKDPDKAFVAALVFAVHPVHVESVAWLKNVSDILVFIFTALSAGLLLRRAGEEEAGARSGAAALLLFLLALASKENAVMMPALALGWFCLGGYGCRRGLRRTLPAAALAAVFLAFAVLAVRRGPALPAFDLKVLLGAFAQYLRVAFLPFDLNADRGVVTPVDLLGPALAAAAAVYFWRKRERAGLYGVLWLLLCLVPFLDPRLVTGRPIAEQRLYTSVLGLGLAAGALYAPALRRMLPLGLAALLFAGFTLARTFDWISPVKFWEKTVAASPDSARARNNLGVSYERAGRLGEAAMEYGRAAALAPSRPDPFLNMADLLYKAGRREDALKVYSEIFAREPGSLRAGLGLLRLQLEAGDAGAEGTLKALMASHGGNFEVLNSSGVYHMMRGETGPALAAFSRAAALNPEYADAYYNMAVMYQRAGDLPAAASAYRSLLRVAPRHADALNNLAIITDMGGDEAGAIALLKRAEEASPAYYQAAYNLGGIYLRNERYLEALAEYSRVLKYRPDHAQAAKKAEEIRRILGETPAK